MTATGTEAVSLAQLKTLADEIVERATYWQTGETLDVTGVSLMPSSTTVSNSTIRYIEIIIPLSKMLNAAPTTTRLGSTSISVTTSNSSYQSIIALDWTIYSYAPTFVVMRVDVSSLGISSTDSGMTISVTPSVRLTF